MSRPGRGDLPVGQFDAQKRLPPGRGIPSFASSGDSLKYMLRSCKTETNLGSLEMQQTSMK